MLNIIFNLFTYTEFLRIKAIVSKDDYSESKLIQRFVAGAICAAPAAVRGQRPVRDLASPLS